MPAVAIIPVLEYPDVPAAVKWLEEAFGFEVRLRIGAHRAQLQFAGGVIVVSESSSPDAAPGSGSVMVRVEAINAHVHRARQRVLKDRLGKDWSPRDSRHSVARPVNPRRTLAREARLPAGW